MSSNELERSLRRFARKERFFRSLVPLGMVGGVIALISLKFSLPPEVTAIPLLWLAWVVMPNSSEAVARLINRRFGEDPDFLCAVEKGSTNAAPIDALRVRAIAKLKRYENTLTLGKKWLALAAVCGWILPLFGALRDDVTISRSEITRVAEATVVESQGTGTQGNMTSRRLPEKVKSLSNLP